MYKVLADWKGSTDGFTVIDYVAGQKVELTPRLAEVALAEGWVEKCDEPSVYAEALKSWVGEPTPNQHRRKRK